MDTSFPFQEGRRNAGGKQEAEGALPTLCPCYTEKQWTSRGDASQATGLEVGLLQMLSVCKGQRKPRNELGFAWGGDSCQRCGT